MNRQELHTMALKAKEQANILQTQDRRLLRSRLHIHWRGRSTEENTGRY